MSAKLKHQGRQEKHSSRYRIIEKLGEGGFGQAWLVEDTKKSDRSRASNSRCVVKGVHFNSSEQMFDATEEADVSGDYTYTYILYVTMLLWCTRRVLSLVSL